MKKNYYYLIGILIFTGISVSQSAERTSQDGNLYELNVQDFGVKGDSVTDNTVAFQKVLDQAAATTCRVVVPAGKYRFDGTLVIPRGVSVVGVSAGPNCLYWDRGTILMPYAGRGDENSKPFITLEAGSTLRGMGIIYPEQVPDNIQPYPYCIHATGRIPSVIDVTIVNAYNGIDGGSLYNEGMNLRDINLCALRRGVYIDRSTDIGRIENVHIHSVAWWDINGGPATRNQPLITMVNDFTKANLEGFIIGRCDWEYMTNCFVIWAKVGFRFIATPDEPDRPGNILVTNSGSDDGPLAVHIEKTQLHAGISFSNCQFMDGIMIDETNGGPIKFTSCGFWFHSSALKGSKIVNRGTGAVMLTACHFRGNEEVAATPEVPIIDMQAGTLQMMNCRFLDMPDAKNPHVMIGKGTKDAAIIGNSVENSSLRIVNKSDKKLQIFGNLDE